MLKDGIIIGERYEIVSRVGAGGMADVYKAMDHKLNRMVAVKILKAEFRQDTSFIAKFRKEAQAAAGLAHPNIVNVYDVGEDRGLYFIVMELVEGITLKNYIMKKGKLSVKEATSIAIQVSLGLEAAHNQGIIHRDVKPQNIIISTDGKVKLSDFGIAKATNSNTITANVMGSVHYSSPEQVRGGFSDAKSDIYSLGITMYEMVTGRVPFDGDTTVSIAIKHLQEEIIPPSRYTSDLPFALEQIILKCTQKNPERRYEDMAGLIDDLKKSLIDPQGNFVVIPAAVAGAQAPVVKPVSEETAAPKKAAPAPKKAEEYYDDDDDDEEEEEVEAKPKKKVKAPKAKAEKAPRRQVRESNDDFVSSKLEKAITIGGFLIGAVIVVILIILVGNMAGLFGSKAKPSGQPSATSSEANQPGSAEVTIIPTQSDSAEMVEVPDFMGKTLDEATEIGNQTGLVVRQSGTQNSDNYEAGQIVYQEILSGTMIKSGSTVNVVVSAGSTNITIPSGLVGKTQTEVEAALAALGVSVQATLQDSDAPIGVVVNMSPQEGNQVAPGSEVYIYISKGPAGSTGELGDPLTQVYPVAGENAALAELGGAGLLYAIMPPENLVTENITVQFVENGVATMVYQGPSLWGNDYTAVELPVFFTPGSTSGVLQIIDENGTLVQAIPIVVG